MDLMETLEQCIFAGHGISRATREPAGAEIFNRLIKNRREIRS